MKKSRLAVGVGIFLLSTLSLAASFDCDKATMPSEKMVCANPTLSTLDDELAATYKKAKAESSNPEKLKQEQIAWIREVRACGTDESCAIASYKQRIAALKPAAVAAEATNTAATATPPVNTEQATNQQEGKADTGSTPAINTQTSVTEQQSPNQADSTAPSREPSVLEIALGYGVGSLLFLIAFAAYIKLPKARFLAIPTPFDIGAKFEKTEAFEAVKGSRQWTEFGLLVCSVLIFVVILNIRFGNGPDTVLTAIYNGAFSFTIAYIFYIIAHAIRGASTRCPSCKNSFARNTIHSYREPRTTYEKRETSFNNNQKCQKVRTIEVGTNHADHVCTVCNHQWHTASNYEREVSSHYTA